MRYSGGAVWRSEIACNSLELGLKLKYGLFGVTNKQKFKSVTT